MTARSPHPDPARLTAPRPGGGARGLDLRPDPLVVSLIPARWRQIHECERGQASVEYLLVMIGVVLPVFLALPMAYMMLYIYFYRVVSVLSLPFP